MSIRFEFTKEGSTRIEKYREQNGLNSTDHFEVQLSKLEYRHPGVVTLILNPILHIKDNLELRANPDCKTCSGKAYIRYWFAQDESRVHPCHICFPETAKDSKEDREYLNRY